MLGFGSFSEGRCSGSEASRRVRDHGEAEGGEVEQVERVLPQVRLEFLNTASERTVNLPIRVGERRGGADWKIVSSALAGLQIFQAFGLRPE